MEASRLAQLRHPNLPVLYGLALTASKGVIVQELCEGESSPGGLLAEETTCMPADCTPCPPTFPPPLLQCSPHAPQTPPILLSSPAGRDLRSSLQLTVRGGDGPAARVFGWHRAGPRVAHDIVKALSYMHARGVCHADVKAANVLLTEHGQAKLADVAFSCRLGSSSGSAGQPRSGTAAAASSDAGVELSASFLGASRPVGTFAWIAPESLLGEPPSAAADVYRCGQRNACIVCRASQAAPRPHALSRSRPLLRPWLALAAWASSCTRSSQGSSPSAASCACRACPKSATSRCEAGRLAGEHTRHSGVPAWPGARCPPSQLPPSRALLVRHHSQARDLMLSCLRLDPAERPTARELLHTLGKLRARRGSTGAADPQVCTLAAAAET